MNNSSAKCVFGSLIIGAALFTWVIITIFLAITKTAFPHYEAMSGIALTAIGIGAGMLGVR